MVGGHPRALNEIVGQYLVSQVDDLLAFREEAVAADIEAESVMLDGAADAADIIRVLFDHRDAIPLPGQQIGGGQPGGSGPDDRAVGAGRPVRVVRHRIVPPTTNTSHTRWGEEERRVGEGRGDTDKVR